MESDLNEVDLMDEDGEVLDQNSELADEDEEDPLLYYEFDVKITESLAYTNQVM
ncbi:hypothetical protein A2U01_0053659, partial [Trifolium medium]|nr:hypothetical protein [Trifolium medium]